METRISSISEQLNQASISKEIKEERPMRSASPSLLHSLPQQKNGQLNMILTPPKGSTSNQSFFKKEENLTNIPEPTNSETDTRNRENSSSKNEVSKQTIDTVLSNPLTVQSNEKATENIETPTNSNSAEVASSHPSPRGRGLVSRRGGRVGSSASPSSRGAFRPVAKTNTSSPSQVIRPRLEQSSLPMDMDERKKLHSINKKNEINAKVTPGSATKNKNLSDEAVPSLCSTMSGSLQTYSSSSSSSPHSPTKGKLMDLIAASNAPIKQKTRSPLHMNPQFDASAMINQLGDSKKKSNTKNENQYKRQQFEETRDGQKIDESMQLRKRKPYSITVDTSCETSPLHHDLKERMQNKTDPTDNENMMEISTNEIKTEKNSKPSKDCSDEKKEEMNESRASCLSYSPPPTGENLNRDSDPKQTPKFELLNFHDPKANSPSGLFLSPYSPLGIIGDAPSFDKITPRVTNNTSNDRSSLAGARLSIITNGNKINQEKALPTSVLSSNPTTPKRSPLGNINPEFSWLTSPSQGFFSPNPSESGGGVALTTPTFSSIFFQESGKNQSPVGSTAKTDENGNAQIRDIQRHHPYSKMICISPLASTKKQRCKSTGDLPNCSLNKDDKSRRKLETYDDLLNVPLSSPTFQVMDMHVAEKDLMEDEDLSALFRLASSSNTNNSTNPSGPSYSRSPGSKKFNPHGHAGKPTPSSLQLPLMSGPEGSMSDSHFPPKLDRMPFRKTNTSKQIVRSMSNEFVPPALPIRPTMSRDLSDDVQDVPSSDAKIKQTSESKSTTSKRIVPTAKKNTKNSGVGSNSDPSKSTKNRKKKNSMILHNPGQLAPPPPPYAPPNPMSVPSGNYQYPSLPGPHPRSMHHPPPGTHDTHGRGHVMGYHDGINHGGHPPQIGDRRPLQHHMPPNPYPQNPNPNPHMRPHPIPPHGQMPNMSSQGNMGPGPYHYPHPPQPPMQSTGQYAPYTSLNQSHAKSKMASKKNSGYGPNMHLAANMKQKNKKSKSTTSPSTKRPGGNSDISGSGKKKAKSTPKKKNSGFSKAKGPSQKALAAALDSGDKNAHAAALAAAILRGVTMRPSGKWQAQLYYAGKSRYIGVFDTREKAALAYEIAREKLKSDKSQDTSKQPIQDTEAAVSLARKAAFEGVNEPDPRPPHKR